MTPLKFDVNKNRKEKPAVKRTGFGINLIAVLQSKQKLLSYTSLVVVDERTRFARGRSELKVYEVEEAEGPPFSPIRPILPTCWRPAAGVEEGPCPAMQIVSRRSANN